MARISPSDIEHKALVRLRSRIREYFEKHWNTDWAGHGSAFSGFDNIHNKNSFYEDVKDRIDQKLIEKHGLAAAAKKSVSVDSIRRFLLKTKDSFDDKVLEAFLLLTGSELSWDEYKITAITPVKSESRKGFIEKNRWAAVAIILIAGLSAAGFYFLKPRKTPDVHFSAVLIDTDGASKKVKISYNLKNAKYNSAVIFFDQYRIYLPSPVGDTVVGSSLPKKSQIKLFLDEESVKEISLLIPSNGWIGNINNRIPYKPEAFLTNGILHFPPSEKMKEIYGREYYTSFMNFREFGISGDAFTLEAEVRNSPDIGGIWAYDVSVDILGSRNGFVFNLLHPDATIYARLIAAGTDFKESSKAEYLSRLGVDLSQWRKLKVCTNNRKFQIILDDEVLVESDYTNEIGELLGIQFYMKGSGAVKNVRLMPYGHPEKAMEL